MVDYRGHVIAKCPMDPHSPDMTEESVISAEYTAIDVTGNNDFAAAL